VNRVEKNQDENLYEREIASSDNALHCILSSQTLIYLIGSGPEDSTFRLQRYH
jgi:hypothetical protein